MKSIVVKTPRGDRTIGPGHPTFVIAEMSGNHNQDFATAEKILRAAAEAGADAIKLQTYTPDTITIDSDKEWFQVSSPEHPGVWNGKTLYQLYQTAYTPWDWHAPLQKIATELGLAFFSTPYDATAVDFLETLSVPFYKIASYEATNVPLLKKVAATGKPVIVSIGFATLEEINLSVTTLREAGCEDIVLLHCVTSYATEPKLAETSLSTIRDLSTRFDVVAGFSDNMGGIEAPLFAALSGASVIEKHLALDNSNAVDAQFSLTPKDLQLMIKAIRRAEAMFGTVHYGPQNATEEFNKRYRQSIFVVQDVKQGDIFTPKNIRCIRPGFGLEPKEYETVLGLRANQDIPRGEPLDWKKISQ